jgi:hemerythrin-like domain-containing protein
LARRVSVPAARAGQEAFGAVGAETPRAQSNLQTLCKEAAMKPTDVLRHEHKIVLLVLEGTELEARSLSSGRPPDVENLGRIVDFLRNFVDRCHHAKEERHLFQMMKLRSPHAADAPVSVLLGEHQEGRRRVAAIAEGAAAGRGDGSAAHAPLAENLVAYVNLMRAHIDKEDNVFFPLADRVLRPGDQEFLLGEFARIETQELGEGVHQRYHQLAHQLGGGG